MKKVTDPDPAAEKSTDPNPDPHPWSKVMTFTCKVECFFARENFCKNSNKLFSFKIASAFERRFYVFFSLPTPATNSA